MSESPSNLRQADDHRIKALLEEIMDSGISPEEACRASPELLPAIKERLRRLRAFEGEVAAIFPPHGLGRLEGGPPDAAVPDIPGYVVLNLLGRGGMGVVYRALQPNLKRTVAIKMLATTGYATEPELARFMREAQAIAVLRHPNIIQVFEVGNLNGRPYFTMEYLEGGNLAQELAGVPRPGREAATMVMTLAEAIHVAHAAGIIHRDLKPSNILLTADGTPKISDFGLARSYSEAPDLTLGGARLGTPSYMSPEQAVGRQGTIGPSTDIYSLGAVLYEMLTGRPPFKAETPAETERQVIAEDPVPPSRLNAKVPRDLETICLKCLCKDAGRRYANASDLADDLRRFLRGEPITARRASALERLGKWVRRHPAPAALLSLTLLTLVSLAIMSINLMAARNDADEKRKTAERERDEKVKALAAEQKARELTMAALRDLADDMVENQMARETQLTEENKEFLRKIIDHFESFAVLTADDAASRAIRAEGHARVGRMRHRLGDFSNAEAAYGTALNLQKQLAADFPARPEFRRDLASTYNNFAVLLEATGRLNEAEAAYATGLELCKHLEVDFPAQPEFRRELAASHDNLGLLLRDTGRLKEAESAFVSALTIQKQLADDFPTRPEFRRDLASSQNYLGLLYRDTDRFEDAEAAFSACVRSREQLVADFPTRPEFRRELAKSHNSRGVLLCMGERFEEAEADFNTALRLQKQLAAEFTTRPEFRHDLSESHNNLGILLRSTGRLKESEAAFGVSLNLLKPLAADFPNQADFDNELAGACVNLANLCNQRKDFHAAKAYLEDARPHHQAALLANPRHPGYRQFFRNNLWALVRANAGLLDRESAVHATEAIRDLGWDPPSNAYDASCAMALCIPLVAELHQLDAAQREEATTFYADTAMRLLVDAVNKGFKDVALMKRDSDLLPLRQRDDFQSLVAELEARGSR